MLAILTSFLASLAYAQQLNTAPANVDVWCGKAYRSTNNSLLTTSLLEAGFQDIPDTTQASLLDFRAWPRFKPSFWNEDEITISISLNVTHDVGTPIYAERSSILKSGDHVYLDVYVGNEQVLEHHRIHTYEYQELTLDTSKISAQIEPYSMKSVLTYGSSQYESTKLLYKLPEQEGSGSAVKLDTYEGGLISTDSVSDSDTWEYIVPYGFYTFWEEYLYQNYSGLKHLQSQGFNTLNIVPTGTGDTGYSSLTYLETFFDQAHELGMRIILNLSGTYKNSTLLAELVNLAKNKPALLMYYTGDEPDGKNSALNGTELAYEQIMSTDPYHPVGLALNCDNYFWDYYGGKGADIVFSDVYPFGINATWSVEYDTVCNSTYGCCGCDNCEGIILDSNNRLNRWHEFDRISSYNTTRSPKTFMIAPQAFGDNTYWAGLPSKQELVGQVFLALNYGIRGFTAWNIPTALEIENTMASITSYLKTLTDYVFYGNSRQVEVKGSAAASIDVKAWSLSHSGGVAVVIVNTANYTLSDVEISIGGCSRKNGYSLVYTSDDDPNVSYRKGTISLAPSALASYFIELS